MRQERERERASKRVRVEDVRVKLSRGEDCSDDSRRTLTAPPLVQGLFPPDAESPITKNADPLKKFFSCLGTPTEHTPVVTRGRQCLGEDLGGHFPATENIGWIACSEKEELHG
jgi:hypothetical protein